MRREDSDRSLSEKQERGREVRIIPDAGRRPFGEAAKQRERAKRDDERWNAEQRHEQRIQASGGHARGDRRGGGERDGPSRVTRRHSENDGAQGEQRSDRQIDPAGENDGRKRQRQQTDLGARAHDLARVVDCEKVRSDDGEHHDFGAEAQGEDAFVGRHPHGVAIARVVEPTASAATAPRMIAPCSARSQ